MQREREGEREREREKEKQKRDIRKARSYRERNGTSLITARYSSSDKDRRAVKSRTIINYS